MKCRVDKDKFLVDNVLKNYLEDEIDIFLLCDEKVEKAQKVFKYLVELYLDINEDSKNEYINKLLTGIISYIEFCNEIKFELSDSDKKIVKNFEKIYCDFVENYNIQLDDNIKKSLEKLKKVLSDNNLSENERILLDKSLELTGQVDILQGQVDALNVKIKLYEDKIGKLETKDQKLAKSNRELNEKVKKLKEEIESLKNENNSLILEKEVLDNKVKDKNVNLDLLEKKIEELNNKNVELSDKIVLIGVQLDEVSDELSKYRKIEEIKNREQELDNYILSKLFEGEFTIFQLFTMLNEEGYSYTREEISDSLKRIKKSVCITDSRKRIVPITYKVSSPIIVTNGNMEINNVTRTYDLLVTADWHLSTEIEISRTLGNIDSLYNYCVANNIGLIINLGDFLDVKMLGSRYEQYTKNMKLLYSIVELFPKDKNIIHAILGGNHDRRMLNLGIDPLKYLEDNRRDFINLGYDDSTISFIKDNNSEFIGLHHPDTFGLQLDDFLSVRDEIHNCLKRSYRDSELTKKDVFLDLFGHFHLSRIDASNHYALVPSFMKMNGQNMNGAFHLKVYFNENNTIDYIIIKSIIPDRTHEHVSEFVYQKK